MRDWPLCEAADQAAEVGMTALHSARAWWALLKSRHDLLNTPRVIKLLS